MNKPHAGDGMVRAGGGSPGRTAQELMRPCGSGQAQRSNAREWLDSIDAGRHPADYLLRGDGDT